MTAPDETRVARRAPSWLRALYALLVVSALALITLLIGDVIAAMEAGAHADETDEGLHHLFVFDLAWPIFLAGSVLTLAAGVGALLVGWLRRDRQATRFAAWSLGYIAVAVVVLFATGALEL